VRAADSATPRQDREERRTKDNPVLFVFILFVLLLVVVPCCGCGCIICCSNTVYQLYWRVIRPWTIFFGLFFATFFFRHTSSLLTRTGPAILRGTGYRLLFSPWTKIRRMTIMTTMTAQVVAVVGCRYNCGRCRRRRGGRRGNPDRNRPFLSQTAQRSISWLVHNVDFVIVDVVVDEANSA
jgi:hypothetical protein